MLSMSSADEIELETWRTRHGRCRLPENKMRFQPSLDTTLERLPKVMAIILRARLKAGGWLGTLRLEASEAAEIESIADMSRRELMVMLLDVASALAQNQPEGEHIGAIVEGRSGGLYIGSPLSWKGAQIKFSVHGVQAAVLNAWHHGEKSLAGLMVEVPPCACCRQFLRELQSWKSLYVVQAIDGPFSLKKGALKDLNLSNDGLRLEGLKGYFLANNKEPVSLGKSTSTNELITKAAEAATMSYAPYSHNYAGLALRTKRGDMHVGSYVETVESVAGILAVEAALVDLALGGGALTDVSEMVLVETRGGVTQFSATQRLAMAMGNIPFRFLMATI